MKFTDSDLFHIQAAQGWLELGNHLEADKELDEITPELRAHPDVLQIRWQIYAKAKKWEACVDIANAIVKKAPKNSFGWIHRSFALHELKRTQEAYELLKPAVKMFPKEWLIRYNLACYTAQLGLLDECVVWFKKAMSLNGKEVKRIAMDDEDLKPLWDSMSGTMWKME